MNENILLMRRAKQQLAGNWVNVAIGALIYIVIMGVASSTYLLELLLFGPLTFGFYLFVACIADTGNNNINLLFKGFERFADTLVAGLLFMLAVSFGLVLLIVPGIIIACGFSMTFYIMVDEQYISGTEALNKSWNMMRGHKWTFFCLQCRFIGWALLCILTCGLGSVLLQPYIVATNQNFYRKIRYGTF